MVYCGIIRQTDILCTHREDILDSKDPRIAIDLTSSMHQVRAPREYRGIYIDWTHRSAGQLISVDNHGLLWNNKPVVPFTSMD